MDFNTSSQLNIQTPRNLQGELEKFYQKPVAKVSLELLLSLLTILFFALFALRPTLTTMTELTKEIEDKKEVDEELQKKITSLSTAQAEYFTYQSRFGVLEDAVHERPTLETALFYLEYLVRRENISLAGLRIETFPLGPAELASASAALSAGGSASPAKNEEIGIYAIQTSFEGEFASILAFFREIESIRPLFVIDSYTISTGSDPNNPLLLRATATIYMYGYRNPAPASPRPSTRSQLMPTTGPNLDLEAIRLQPRREGVWRG